MGCNAKKTNNVLLKVNLTAVYLSAFSDSTANFLCCTYKIRLSLTFIYTVFLVTSGKLSSSLCWCTPNILILNSPPVGRQVKLPQLMDFMQYIPCQSTSKNWNYNERKQLKLLFCSLFENITLRCR